MASLRMYLYVSQLFLRLKFAGSKWCRAIKYQLSALSYWDGWAKLAFLDSKRRSKEFHLIFKIGSNSDELTSS